MAALEATVASSLASLDGTAGPKSADRPMDLADASLVRMTELSTRCKIWTVDREDFSTYRRHGRQAVPCEFPSEV